jgi:Mn2+/Fe2+ NRAMP family transporter
MILVLGASVVLIPDLPLIKVMWFSQIINCFLLPAIIIFMIKLVNDRELMGDYRNSLWMNIVAYTGAVILTVLNVVLLYNAFRDVVK